MVIIFTKLPRTSTCTTILQLLLTFTYSLILIEYIKCKKFKTFELYMYYF